jgi:glycosyltransferase involved in cell wall biosynthesis
MTGRAPIRVAYVVRSWPRLSQTFILNEVLALERLGLSLVIFSMTAADDDLVQDAVGDVRAPVHLLDGAANRGRARAAEHAGVLLRSPRRYLGTLLFVVRHPELSAGYTTTTRAACFSSAVHVAAIARAERRRGRPFARIHAHFAHDPALIGLLSHRLTRIPFSLTAHARDLYGIPRAALAARTDAADAVVTCCRQNEDYLRRMVRPKRLHMIHHGVDLERFRPRPRPVTVDVPVILSVGRLVEKKGWTDLLHAFALLAREGRRFRALICGEGPLRPALEGLRDELGLSAEVRLLGPRGQTDLLSLLQGADMFALVPVVANDGDRDGVPNALVEAMACGLPVVSTDVGGVPDLVRHEENGLLAPARDSAAIAGHIGRLLDDNALRHALGASARRTVEQQFDIRAAALELAGVFAVGRREAV